MRRLGYPPGHLEEARIVESGLALYEEHQNKRAKRNKEDQYGSIFGCCIVTVDFYCDYFSTC